MRPRLGDWVVDVLGLVAAFAVLSCGETGGLPTDPGGSTSGRGPALVSGDSIVVIHTRPSTAPARCRDLPHESKLVRGDTMYLCIPVEAYAAGVTEVSITATEKSQDPVSGTWTDVDAYRGLSIPGLSTKPQTKRAIYTPLLAPVSGQTTGAVTFTVHMAGKDSTTTDRTATATIVDAPQIRFLSPAEDEHFMPGDPIVAKVSVQSAGGVHAVTADWSGIATYSETLDLRDTATATIAVSAPSTAYLAGGDLTLTIRATDSRSAGVSVAKRVIHVDATADTVMPAPRAAVAANAYLEDGARIPLRATDRGGVRVLGVALVTTAKDSVLWSDSLVYPTPAAVATDTITLHIPASLTGGDMALVAFARDAHGNRAWAKDTIAGVPKLTDATTVPVHLTSGTFLPVTGASALFGSIVHLRRDEWFVTDSARNQVRVFSLASRSFVAAIPVGSSPRYLAVARDANGEPTDTLVVSNGGGTDLSVVDLAARSEVRRVVLPRLGLVTIDSTFQTKDSTWKFTEKEVLVSDRPAYVAVACVQPTCLSHQVYLSTLPTATTAGSITRVFPLNDASAAALISPPYQTVAAVMPDTMDATTIRLSLLDTELNRNTVLWQRMDRSLSATLYSVPPLIAVPEVGSNAVYVGEVTNTSASKRNRLLRLRPADDWSGLAAAADDYTRNAGETIRAMDVNRTGSIVAISTPTAAFIVDDVLRRRGTFDHSNTTAGGPSAVALLRTIPELDPGTPTYAAVAQNGAGFIDVYGLDHFALKARFAVREPVTGPLLFAQRTNGKLIIVGRTKNGLVVIETSATEIEARAATVQP